MGLFNNIFPNPQKRGTQLLGAIISGNTRKACILIKKRTDLNVKTDYGKTALILASEKGYIEIIQPLIEKGADVNVIARWKKHEDYQEDSLGRYKEMKYVNSYQTSALNTALEKGHPDIALLLIEKGANVNVISELHVEEYEVGYVAPPDLDKPGEYQRVGSFEGYHYERLVETKSYKTPAINSAVEKGYPDIVRILIENGANINAEDHNEKTALALALEKGHSAIARLLIEKGADINARTNKGRTALHWASGNADLEMVRLLIENGATINVRDHKGKTALHLATETGNSEIVKFLLERGADF